MDIETLTNNITGLSKHYFENACKLVLKESFNLNVINIDGKNDGGTDFSAFDETKRIDAAYQITTQKSAIQKKAYNDAKKAIDKLGIQRFFFLTSYNLDEIETRKLENTISKELGIATTCLPARNIAGLMIEDNLLNQFLEETNYPLPKSYKSKLDFKEMALHSYTLISDDANKLKFGIYDDTLTLILSEHGILSEDELIDKVSAFLALTDEKNEIIKRRIGALFGKEVLMREDGQIKLRSNIEDDLRIRKSLYEIELASLSSAQVDLMRTEYNTDWNEEDSKKVALWIANAYISEQISSLKDAKASIVSNPLFKIEENGLEKIKQFLLKEKKVDKKKIGEITKSLLDNASAHPLITKLSRASIYIALEGANPIASAKALGANRWSEFNILIEPTVAIPYVCSQLYSGKVNQYFDNSINAVKQALSVDSNLFIPYFYINECAGHLLKARRYIDIELDENELIYSNNAFVSNYFALKLAGESVPNSLLEYLYSFSTAIKIERADIKSWVRAIMTDMQSLLSRGGIEFIDVPFYHDGDCDEFEKEYMFHLNEYDIDKKAHLIKHDIFALQFTNDKILKENEHWIILTYDKSMISISQSNLYKGWITNPIKFTDFTQISKPLSETKLISLVHSVATYSEATLAVGARIIDRVIKFASKKMQNWEFKQEFEKFKEELISSIDLHETDFSIEIDRKTDEFLQKLGVFDEKSEDEFETDV